jgi:hypothetical protein
VSTRDVSLAGELGLLRQALAAAADLLEPSALGEELSADAGRYVLAVVSVAEARVAMLRRAIVGAADPSLLRSRHNDVIEPHRATDDPDVVLRAWRRERDR